MSLWVDRLVSGSLVALFAAIAIWNAAEYPPVGGYDAAEHIAYAHQLVDDWSLPETGASYTPPGFYLLAGGATRVGEWLDLYEPERAALYVNALIGVGTALLLLVMASLLFPGRAVLRWAALAFFLCCPLVLKVVAMFHPQPLALFLSTLALTLTTWMIVRRRYTWQAWLGLALILGAAQLVRSVSLVTVAVVLFTLLVAAAVDPESRRRIRTAMLVFAAAVVLVPLPWYVYLQVTTSSAIFGRAGVTSSLFDTAWPAAFYVSPGLPSVITDPHRPTLPPRLFPTLYADTWGDYFGNWSWGPPRPELTPEVNRRLTIQSLVGLPLTALAVAGWLALAGLVAGRRREHPARVSIVLMPAAAVAAVLFYATQAPHPDGDTVKALFLLPAVPAWAISFGFALDVLLARNRSVGTPVAVLLAACGLVSLAYATFVTVS
ncbi:MAG TPA: hypothetical protein VM184_10165 [Gaiellaceae bacterium]|nr:hypothetical protein [Gaiellaceae bacterium]